MAGLESDLSRQVRATHGTLRREFRGIRNYKPISDKYPGLLHVDFVSVKKEEGYFYYVMELGDAEKPGWEKDPSTYRPQDLSSRLAQSPGHELPVAECVRILLALTEAVEFLHSEGFAHRDIKPSNVIFVAGCPKLADVGLVRETHPEGDEMTFVGTPGYMPPAPEFPGTIAADVYALGMMLYVISTGQAPASFPEISTRLVANETPLRFMKLNAIILKACHPDRIMRYSSAAAMHEALLDLQGSPAD
jgi:serine/threonine protein kinase